jgi:proline dehydrogenase
VKITMSVMRSLLLAASQNVWLRDHAANYRFVRRSVSRFMPGETLEEALAAAQVLKGKSIGSVFTRLGENVNDRGEAAKVAEHYLEVLDRVAALGLGAEISVKLTQLGLDLSPEFCFENLSKIVQRAPKESTIWVDMEASSYVDATLEIYTRTLREHSNVGICLQAYLFRTKEDFARLLPLKPSIRLVKGAYSEAPEVAFPLKKDVDESYFALAQEMLRAKTSGRCPRAAFGTHDVNLVRRISEFAASQGIEKGDIEVQMLFGIQREEQERLAESGCRSMVLIGYGSYWYPWFLRRLAERPANVWFLLKNIF